MYSFLSKPPPPPPFPYLPPPDVPVGQGLSKSAPALQLIARQRPESLAVLTACHAHSDVDRLILLGSTARLPGSISILWLRMSPVTSCQS